MPQFNMLIVNSEDTAGAKIETHVAGKPLREGDEYETYRCGDCKTNYRSVSRITTRGIVIKCGKINDEPHHRHH